MFTKEDKAKAAKGCLDFNKKFNVVHVTSDTECFPDAHHAILHARTLEDKNIEVFERSSNDVVTSLLKSVIETATANTEPDATLAGKKAAGKAKGEQFKKADKKPVEKQNQEGGK